jgi:hypothetical protein
MQKLTTIFATTAFLSASSTHAAVVYMNQSYPFSPSNQIQINLDGVNGDDLLIDLGTGWVGMRDAPYTVTTLGGAAIAANGGIATSFHIAEFIELASQNLVSSPGSVLAGGTVTDAFGNIAFEGWGVEFNELGGPAGPPENFVDLFVVDLPDGVAWVDLSVFTPFGEQPVRWGYLETTSSSFQITGIPEVSTFALIGMSCIPIALRRRRTALPFYPIS